MLAKRSFSHFLIWAFAASLFYPFAYAQPTEQTAGGTYKAVYFAEAQAAQPAAATAPSVAPTQTQVGSCVIDSFDEAGAKRFLDASFGFRGKELTDRSDASIRTTQPATEKTVINNNIYNFPAEESITFMKVKELAQILGKGEQFIIDELGLEDGLEPNADGTAPKAAIAPGDQTVTVAQARAVAQKIDPSGDALAKIRSFMQSKGKSKDLVEVPGFENMKIKLPNGKEMPLSDIYHYQALRSAEGSVACLLNNSAINGKISYVGLIDQNLLLAADQAKSSLVHNQHVSTQTLHAAVNNYDGNIVIPSFYEKAVILIGKLAFWDLFLSGIMGVSASTEGARLSKQTEVLRDDVDAFARTLPREIPPGAAGEALLNDRQRLLAQYSDARKSVLQLVDRYGTFGATRAAKNFWLGSLWLGPSRIALELANQVSFSAPGPTTVERGQALEIYADNRDFARVFRRTSDWFHVGSIMEAISEVASFSVPGKAFDVGRVYLLQTPGNSGKEKLSQTSITMSAEGNWLVHSDWQGNSQVTVFEDIHDGRKVASLAVRSSNLTIGGVIQRKKETEQYFDAIRYVAPILSWRLIAPGAAFSPFLTTILQIQATDIFIDNIVDPDIIAPDEACSDAKLIRYWRIYEGTVALSLLEQFFLYTKLGSKVVYELGGIPQIEKLSDSKYLKWLLGKSGKSEVASRLGPLAAERDELILDANARYVGGEIGGAEAASRMVQARTAYAQQEAALQKAGQGFSTGSTFIESYRNFNLLDPIELLKASAGSAVMHYASTCKDSEYKVLSFQRLETKVPSSTIKKLQNKVNDPLGVNKITNSLNIGQAFAGVGKKIQENDLKEVLNIRAALSNQNGDIKPAELYYLHLDPENANMQWFDVFSNACFRECQDAGDKFFCRSPEGAYLVDKKTGEKTYLAGREQALMGDFIPGLGTVIPNKLISAPLNCPDEPIMRIDGNGKLTITDSSCEAMQCSVASLQKISGINSGTDLSRVLGSVQAIYTTQTTGSPNGGVVKIFRKTGVQYGGALTSAGGVIGKSNFDLDKSVSSKTSLPLGVGGALVQASSAVSSQQSIAGREYRVSSIEIFGNPKVRVTGSVKDEDQFGELRTIQLDNGVINYDPVTHKLFIALKVLAEIPARDVAGITTSPGSISAPKSALQDDSKKLIELIDKLATGQKITDDKLLELLRRSLDRPLPTGSTLSAEEKALLQKALDKQISGQPLSQAEQNVLQKARDAEKYPGVVVLTPAQTNVVDRSLQGYVKDDNQRKSIVEDLRQGKPISSAEKEVVSKAIDSAVASKSVSVVEAADVKKVLDKTVPTSEKTAGVLSAVQSGGALSAEQRQAAIDAIRAEKARVDAQAASSSSTSLPGIKLSGASPKPGGEDNVRDLNRALDKLGTLTSFKTPNKEVLFTTNDQGQAVVKIADSNTKKVDEFKITGEARRDGQGIVFPTDKGPVKIEVNVNKDNGAPVFNLNAPNNITEKAPLIIAAGQNGLLFYDPQTGTWRVQNGLPFSADSAFGQKGVTAFGSPDGTRAIPTDDFLGFKKELTGTSGYGSLLSLPSWPENVAIALLTLLSIVGGVLIVRRQH